MDQFRDHLSFDGPMTGYCGALVSKVSSTLYTSGQTWKGIKLVVVT